MAMMAMTTSNSIRVKPAASWNLWLRPAKVLALPVFTLAF